MAKQFVTQQLKWSHNLQHTTLTLTRLDGWSSRPDPINQQVMSSPSTYMIVPNIFFKFLWWQTSNQTYFIFKVQESCGWNSIMLRKIRFWVSWVWHSTASDGKAPVLEFGKYGVPLQYHYSPVHSDLEWKYLLVLSMSQMQLFNPLLRIIVCSNLFPGYDTKLSDGQASVLGNVVYPFIAISPRFTLA